jgi:hypothetical protein
MPRNLLKLELNASHSEIKQSAEEEFEFAVAFQLEMTIRLC